MRVVPGDLDHVPGEERMSARLPEPYNERARALVRPFAGRVGFGDEAVYGALGELLGHRQPLAQAGGDRAPGAL